MGEILRREYPAEFVKSGDGRTLEVRIVPYNQRARVADPPHYVPYDETFVEGAFDKQLAAPNRVSVFMNVEHEPGIGGVVGRGTELREVPGDGLHGTFRMLNHPDADKALELVNEGDLTGVSLEFDPIKSVREDGVVKRLKARLVNVALVRPSGSPGGIQAYQDAGVLAVRETVAEPESEGVPLGVRKDPPPATEVVGAVGAQPFRVTVDKHGRMNVDMTGTPTEDLVRSVRAGIANQITTASSDVRVFPESKPEPEADPERRSEVDELLTRVGYEPMLKRAIVRGPWDGAASRFDDAQWARSCILDRGQQFDTAKTRYAFPVLEPNGDLNVNGMHAEAARLNQAQASPAAKATAARKLIRLYRQAGEDPPPALVAMAGRS